jgi:hypothetical protein
VSQLYPNIPILFRKIYVMLLPQLKGCFFLSELPNKMSYTFLKRSVPAASPRA